MRDDAKAKLATSAIAPAEAEDAGIFSVGDASRIHDSFAPVPAIAFPYFRPDGSKMTWGRDNEPFIRVRYLAPVYPRKKSWGPKKTIRYAQPIHSPIKPYFPWVGHPDDDSPWRDILDSNAAKTPENA